MQWKTPVGRFALVGVLELYCCTSRAGNKFCLEACPACPLQKSGCGLVSPSPSLAVSKVLGSAWYSSDCVASGGGTLSILRRLLLEPAKDCLGPLERCARDLDCFRKVEFEPLCKRDMAQILFGCPGQSPWPAALGGGGYFLFPVSPCPVLRLPEMAEVFQEMGSETGCLCFGKEENQRVFLLSQRVGRWGERVVPLPLASTELLVGGSGGPAQLSTAHRWLQGLLLPGKDLGPCHTHRDVWRCAHRVVACSFSLCPQNNAVKSPKWRYTSGGTEIVRKFVRWKHPSDPSWLCSLQLFVLLSFKKYWWYN